jgi:DNA polymerase beta
MILGKSYIGIHLNDVHYESLLNALKIALKFGANVLQIYMGDKRLTTLTKKYRFTNDEIKSIKLFLKKHSMKLVIHAILSLNYCNDPKLPRNQWGIDNLTYDMNMCYKLGGIGCVIHMGTHKTLKINISYDECINNFISTLIIVLDKTKKIPIILETPVNRKNIVGGTIEGMSKLYNMIPKDYQKRVKICIDTQHIFASGYNIRTEETAKKYFEEIDKHIGINNIAVIHLNDSLVEFDSHINRHESIGKGFIFSGNSSKEALKYIINLTASHDIPIVLETKYEYYDYEVPYLKKMLIKKGGSKDIKESIIKIFKEILLFHETLGKKGNMSTKFRIESYKKAIKSLENFDGPIYDSQNIKDLQFIGKGFKEKINEIAKKGTLNIYENIKKNNSYKSLILFQGILGIGPEMAQKIISQNIFTIQELREAVKNNQIHFTRQQLIGLKYYEDLNKRIPRKEILEYTTIIKDLIETSNIHVHNAGSYRLGKKDSGDIDLIISYDREKLEDIKSLFYNKLRENNIIIDTISIGKQKSMYIVKLPTKYYRKIDVAIIDNKYLPWYLLYFGSSREFSKKIRLYASKLGYKLNESGLYDKNSGERINFYPKNEEEIFKYLNMDYVRPENRY